MNQTSAPDLSNGLTNHYYLVDLRSKLQSEWKFKLFEEPFAFARHIDAYFAFTFNN